MAPQLGKDDSWVKGLGQDTLIGSSWGVVESISVYAARRSHFRFHFHFAREVGAKCCDTQNLDASPIQYKAGLAGQQLNICEAMPGKLTPTGNNCDCEQAVMEYLKAAAVAMQLECADAAYVNMQMQTQAVRRRKGGREEWGQKSYQVKREERGRGAQKRRAGHSGAGCRAESRRRT